MACWWDLYEFLLSPEMTPRNVVVNLNVKPSRLKKMLASKRMAQRIANVEVIAARRSRHYLNARVDDVTHKLTGLTTMPQGETMRKACLDVIRQVRENQRQDQPAVRQKFSWER